MTPMVMYCPGSNGVGSPSKRTQKYASFSVSSTRRIRRALYCGASASMTRGSAARSVIAGWYPAGRGQGVATGGRTPARAVMTRSGDQPPLLPVPRHDTFGFQSENFPFGFDLYSQ